MVLKLTEEHWNVIIKYMVSHRKFARGQFSGPQGKKNQKGMWMELSSMLNSLGGGQKPVEKWQKVNISFL